MESSLECHGQWQHYSSNRGTGRTLCRTRDHNLHNLLLIWTEWTKLNCYPQTTEWLGIDQPCHQLNDATKIPKISQQLIQYVIFLNLRKNLFRCFLRVRKEYIPPAATVHFLSKQTTHVSWHVGWASLLLHPHSLWVMRILLFKASNYRKLQRGGYKIFLKEKERNKLT